MRKSIIVLFICLSSCHLQPKFRTRPTIGFTAHFQLPPATWEECKILDRNYIGWTVSAALLGVLGGASGGITSAFDDATPRYITGSLAAGLSAVGAIGGFLSSHYAKRYVDRCSENKGGN